MTRYSPLGRTTIGPSGFQACVESARQSSVSSLPDPVRRAGDRRAGVAAGMSKRSLAQAGDPCKPPSGEDGWLARSRSRAPRLPPERSTGAGASHPPRRLVATTSRANVLPGELVAPLTTPLVSIVDVLVAYALVVLLVVVADVVDVCRQRAAGRRWRARRASTNRRVLPAGPLASEATPRPVSLVNSARES